MGRALRRARAAERHIAKIKNFRRGGMDRRMRFALALIVLTLLPSAAHAQTAAALMQQSAQAMGGLAALRALKTQALESEGKQFDSSSTQQPLGPTRQIGTFRYTLTRDLTRPRLRLEWEGKSLAGNPPARWIETIDGDIGMLQEGSGRRVEG